MKPFFLFLVVGTLGACSPTGSISADQPEGPDIKLPPESKPGEGTNGACNGITDRGECQEGVAVTCDVASDELRQVDCTALGQDCAIDPDRGAGCYDLGLGAPSEGPCQGLVNATGECTPEGAAVWCDIASNQIYAWTCAQSGLACQVDACQSGAYCCEEDPVMEPDPTECEMLGFEGVCEGQVARWCAGGTTVVELDCEADGKVCAYDECAVGAYCCNPPQQVNPCPDLGVYGQCGGPGGQTMSYCLGETLYETVCENGNTCQLDVCFNGADCCTPAEYTDACNTMGLDGKCGGADGNTRVWCENAVIQRQDCPGSCALNGTVAECV